MKPDHAAKTKAWDEQLDALGYAEKWEKRFKQLVKQGKPSLAELEQLLEGATFDHPLETQPLASEPPLAMEEEVPGLAEMLEPEADVTGFLDHTVPQSELSMSEIFGAQRTTLLEDSEPSLDEVVPSFPESIVPHEPRMPSEPSIEAALDGEPVSMPQAPSVPSLGTAFRAAPPPPPIPSFPVFPSSIPSQEKEPLEALEPQVTVQLTQDPEESIHHDSTDFDFDTSGDGAYTKVATSDSIIEALKKVAMEQGADPNSPLFRSLLPSSSDSHASEETFVLDDAIDADGFTDLDIPSTADSWTADKTEADPGPMLQADDMTDVTSDPMDMDEPTEAGEPTESSESAKPGFFKRLFKSKS